MQLINISRHLQLASCSVLALGIFLPPDVSRAEPPTLAERVDSTASGQDGEGGTDAVRYPEAPSVTEHRIAVGGQEVSYRATAGTLPVFRESDGVTEARIFYVSYERTDVDNQPRPVTFCFNGGPGSSSVWLHLGAWGPKRVEMGDAGDLLPPPWKLVDNEATLLDQSDLVFIDPVTTGFSRAEEGVDDGDFHGLEQDVASVAEFIRLWTTRNERWESPKFLAGESYGTTRAAALCRELQSRHGMFLNGIVLVSAVLDFGTVRFNRANILPDVLFLPTYAATAWYHGKVDKSVHPTVEDVVGAAEAFALETYLPALARGSSLDAKDRASVVSGLSELTGLTPAFIELADLRITPSRFRKELMRSKREMVGRLDSRFVGFDADAVGERPEYDPSYAAIQGPFTATLNQYLRKDLGYASDLPYEILTGRVRPWDYGGFENRYVDVAGRLRSAMVRNPDLRVFVAAGYYDLATPHFASDWVVDHLELEPVFRTHIERTYYPAGHMMYIEEGSRAQLDADLKAFYERTLKVRP